MRLWRNNPETPEGKYLVLRRDGTVPEWPYFVIAASDPAAPDALIAYAREALLLGMDEDYCRDVTRLAYEFNLWREEHGDGDPDGERHRKDDPKIIEMMRNAKGS